jgi:hypothetical protein
MDYMNTNQNRLNSVPKMGVGGTRKDKFETSAVRALAVVGLVAILGIGLWGSATMIRSAPTFLNGIQNTFSTAAVYLSSIFRTAEKLELTISPTTIESGGTFSFGWTHSGKTGEGKYEFLYECLDGAVISRGESKTLIPCNEPILINTTNQHSSYTLISKTSRFLDVPLTISFVPEGEETGSIKDSKLLTVINDNILQSRTETGTLNSQANSDTTENTAPTSTATNTNTSTDTTSISTDPLEETTQFSGNTTTTEDPNGKPDLKVTFIETGYVDKATNEFIASSTPLSPTLRIAVRFSIENAGTKTSPQWSFNAVLPTSPYYVYHSNGQRELKPGDKIEYTLGFDQTKSEETIEVIVNADPTRSINELDEDNNIEKVAIKLAVTN